MIRIILEALDHWLNHHDPRLAETLRPPITKAGLKKYTDAVGPFHFPQEALTLYHWHNGQEASGELFAPYRFLPLDEAVPLYQEMLALNAQLGSWNPLWFPFLDFEGDLFVYELGTPPQPDTPVYFCPSEDPDLYVWTRNLTQFFELILALFAQGALIETEGIREMDPDAVDRIRHSLCPTAHYSGKREIEGVTYFSKFATAHWPSRWKEVGTQDTTERRQRSANRALLSVQAARTQVRRGVLEEAILQGTVARLSGTLGGALMELSDQTGQIPIFCPPPIARELYIRASYEVWVERVNPATLPNLFSEAMLVASAVQPLDPSFTGLQGQG